MNAPCQQWERWEEVGKVPVPPVEEVRRRFLCFWRRVGLEKVDYELIELLVAKLIVVARPVGRVRQIEV